MLEPRSAPIELILPFPPSVNRIWKWVGGRTGSNAGRRVSRSDEYESWLKTCDGAVLEQLGVPAYRPKMIRTRYRLTVTLDATRFGKVDQDNCVKAVSDFLQRSRIIANDKWAWKTMILWGDIETPHTFQAACLVQVEEI